MFRCKDCGNEDRNKFRVESKDRIVYMVCAVCNSTKIERKPKTNG